MHSSSNFCTPFFNILFLFVFISLRGNILVSPLFLCQYNLLLVKATGLKYSYFPYGIVLYLSLVVIKLFIDIKTLSLTLPFPLHAGWSVRFSSHREQVQLSGNDPKWIRLLWYSVGDVSHIHHAGRHSDAYKTWHNTNRLYMSIYYEDNIFKRRTAEYDMNRFWRRVQTFGDL